MGLMAYQHVDTKVEKHVFVNNCVQECHDMGHVLTFNLKKTNVVLPAKSIQICIHLSCHLG